LRRTSVHSLFWDVPHGTETILLAEDEQDVREVARELLEFGGQTVIEATNGRQALRLSTERKAAIDQVVTDMVMPEMMGQDLARLLRHEHFGIGAIYMSGYTEQTAEETAQA
jgi:two-component system, cell cycle sensor histidine kinase and response regulator CckA